MPNQVEFAVSCEFSNSSNSSNSKSNLQCEFVKIEMVKLCICSQIANKCLLMLLNVKIWICSGLLQIFQFFNFAFKFAVGTQKMGIHFIQAHKLED